MASDNAADVSVAGNSSENADYDPKLDFFSDQFDPLLALNTPGVKVPVVNARVYDNIHMYQSARAGKSQQKPEKRKNEPVKVESTYERQWLPHQLPVKCERTFTRRNVFTKMDAIEGPLKLLRICKDKRQRIKVWTRHSHGIRGYCLAYVIAFDKHWNLALEDVDEVWTRPKKRKVPALDSAKTDCRIRPKVMPPQVVVVKSTKKTETCSRHVEQLLLRGEHVVFVVLVPEEKQVDS